MTDKVSPGVRSLMMSAVRGRDTGPERAVRRELFANGFRYRLHRRDLPGKPDIVLPAYHMAIFVHGCFWHGHTCSRGKRPSSNLEFWNRKLDGNRARDQLQYDALIALGWQVVVIWECDLQPAVRALVEQLETTRQALRRAFTKELTK